MKQHVHRIAATCFFHLRRLRQIRRRIGRDLTVRLILIDATIHQNAAARLVFELRGCEHVTLSLIQLHWLPVRWFTSSCAQSCTQCTQADVRRTCRKQYTLSAAQQHVLDTLDSVNRLSFHDYVRSSANAPSPTVLRQSSRVEFSFSTRPRRDGLLSF